MNRILRQLPKQLAPVRILHDRDYIREGGFHHMAKPLPLRLSLKPILERYPKYKTHYFGIYSGIDQTPNIDLGEFMDIVVSFFLGVAESQLASSRRQDEADEAYRHVENRTAVRSHLHRERSSELARRRKIHDDYECQVCGFRFADCYGDLGRGFAEAHHLDALSGISHTVISGLEDVATVCANCHRMLHRMAGRRGDFAKLQGIFHAQRGRRSKGN